MYYSINDISCIDGDERSKITGCIVQYVYITSKIKSNDKLANSALDGAKRLEICTMERNLKGEQYDGFLDMSMNNVGQ